MRSAFPSPWFSTGAKNSHRSSDALHLGHLKVSVDRPKAAAVRIRSTGRPMHLGADLPPVITRA